MSEPHVRLAGAVARSNGTAVRRATSPMFHASFPAEKASVVGVRHALMAWVDACRVEHWRRSDIALAVTRRARTSSCTRTPATGPG